MNVRPSPPKQKKSCVPEALTQKQPSMGSRVSETARSESRKRGCLSQLTASRPHLYPDVMRLSIRHSDHTDAHGNFVHGCKHLHGPALSQSMKDWVRTSLLNGSTTQRILKQHAKSAMPPINSKTADSSKLADKDCFLNSQDIRNIGQKLAQLTWKLHDNEAQSVCLFYQQLSDSVFMYHSASSC